MTPETSIVLSRTVAHMVDTPQAAGYESWDKPYQPPFKMAIRTKPTWVPQKTQKTESAIRHRVKTLIESE
jgi:hypothetical protein